MNIIINTLAIPGGLKSKSIGDSLVYIMDLNPHLRQRVN